MGALAFVAFLALFVRYAWENDWVGPTGRILSSAFTSLGMLAAELKNLVAAYRTMGKAKPPKGDDASWKEKCDKLLAGAEALASGAPDGLAKYKEALNCKACHSVHKPD